MQLELTTEDAHTLYDLLHAYLPDLQREVARTEAQPLRHTMVRRQELCERLLAKLAALGADVPSA